MRPGVTLAAGLLMLAVAFPGCQKSSEGAKIKLATVADDQVALNVEGMV